MSNSDSLPPEAIDRAVDQACNRFEAGWRTGNVPSIEALVQELQPDARPAIVRELIALDVHYRRLRGQNPCIADYVGRFAEIDEVALAQIVPEATSVNESIAPPTPTLDHTTTDTLSSTPPLRIVGGYEVLGEIARGGMGVVYRARQQSLNRQVALKMILPGQLVTAEATHRFRTEAENVARLQHENIVPIYEVGEYEGQPFFSMKLIEGGSLDRCTERYVRDPRATACLMATVARAVHHAHQHGLIHRDLKPSNVLVDRDGQPHVTDFGLAKRLEASIDLTRSNAIVGTPCYMAPEQAGGRQQLVSTVTDVYGLGAILYEMLTGRPPFKADTPLDTLAQVLHDEPVSPRTRRPEVPRDLAVICMKCLHKEPERRYDSAAAMADDLDRWLEGTPITARAITSWERGVRWMRRHPARAALVMVSFLASLATVWLLVAQSYTSQLEEANSELETKNDELNVAFDTVQKEKQEAERQRARAKDSEANARGYLYVTRMTQADQARKAGNIGRMMQLLRSVIPESPDQEDLRGWEWYQLWRAHQGEQSRLRGHTGPITSVAFSPDERLLASASEDHTVRVWDAVNGKLLATLAGHSARVNCVAFSEDGKRLASAADDRTIRIWDANTRKQLSVLEGHTDRVTSVVFCPTTHWIVSGSYDRSVRLWEPDGKLSKALMGHGEPVHAVSISADGKTIAGVSQGVDTKKVNSGQLIVWDRATSQVLLESRGSDQVSVAFHPESGRVAYVVSEKEPMKVDSVAPLIHILDLGPDKKKQTLAGHTASIAQIAITRDGKQLLSASYDQTLRLWDLATGKEITQFHEDGPALAAAISPDGMRYASGGEDGVVKIWAAPQPQPRVMGPGYAGVAFSPDGLQLAGVLNDNTLVWDVRSGAQIANLKGLSACRMAWSRDGGKIAGQGSVWDLTRPPTQMAMRDQQGREIKKTNYGVLDMAFTPDGSLVAGAKDMGGKEAIRVWETRTGRVVRSFSLDAWAMSVDVSPDARWIAAGTSNDIQTGRSRNAEWLKVWDLSTGEPTQPISGFRDCVWRVRFSRDGRYLAAAIGFHWGNKLPGEIRVWKVGTWELVWRLRGHSEIVYSIAFSPDGRRLVSTGGRSRAEVKIWDLTTGQELADIPLPAQAQTCHDAAFSPDGQRLALAVTGKTYLYDGTPLAEVPPFEPLPNDK